MLKKGKRKTKNLNENDFFRELVIQSGMPEDTCRRVYQGMIRVMIAEMREYNRIKFPHIGELGSTGKRTQGRRRNIAGGWFDVDVFNIRFKIDPKLKEYLNMIWK